MIRILSDIFDSQYRANMKSPQIEIGLQLIRKLKSKKIVQQFEEGDETSE